MGKYTALQDDIFSIFGSDSWKAEKIQTYPSNFTMLDKGREFIRISILPQDKGLNLSSVSGMLMIDIFVTAGNGPSRSLLIADKLDQYLVGKSIETVQSKVTQFMNSNFAHRGVDTDNPTLFRSSYTIPFNYFGAE